MTLVEVLVAMVILLVGVWTVAAGFPSMMRSVTLEQQRTQGARMAEARVESLTRTADALPVAIRAPILPTTDPGDIWPDAVPEDPDNPASPLNAPNSRDDITKVVGERARVPAPPPGDRWAIAVLSQGMLQQDNAEVAVWETVPLEQMPFAPPGAAPQGCFYLEASGVLSLPTGYDGALVDYVWEDTAGLRHWVQGERIPASGSFVAGPGQLFVRPRATFNDDGSFPYAGTVPTTARVFGLRAFPVVDADGDHPWPGEVAIEPSFGVGLMFAAPDAGRNMLVDYRLKLVDAKRLLHLSEEQVVPDSACSPDPGDPAYCFATVQLGWSGLAPVFTDPTGTPVHVIGVDLESTGSVYYETAGITPVDAETARMSRIQLHLPVGSVGHQFRFYYGTADQAAVEVYKAPATYFDDLTASCYATPGEVQFRTYRVGEAVPGSPFSALSFSMSNLGAAVAVDYVWDDGGVARLMVGELHTLGLSPAGNAAVCSLNRPNLLEIRAVRGVSLKVRPWWRTPAGRLVHYDLDTILTPTGAL